MPTGRDRSKHDQQEPNPGRSLAARLDYLFRTIRHGAEEYSHREVARVINARASSGPEKTTVSHTVIGNIRNGTETNPKIGTLAALAEFFGVDVAYFTTNAITEEVVVEVELASALARIRESDEARTLVVRTRGLSDQGLRSVLKIVNTILEMEQQPGTSTPERGTE